MRGGAARQLLIDMPAALRLAGIVAATMGGSMLLYDRFLGIRLSNIRLR